MNKQLLTGPWLVKFSITAIVLLVLPAACYRDDEHSAEFFVFGTTVEVRLWGASEDQAARVFPELQQMFQGMHRDWHAWEPGRLTDINAAFVRSIWIAVSCRTR